MNGRPGPPPISPSGSEWSGYSHYHQPPNQQAPYSPGFPSQRGDLITPPISGSSNGTQPRMSNGMNRRPGDPSPPNSIARSSYGASLSTSDHQRRKTMQMEERLSQHYVILRRYLGQSLRDEKGNPKPNRARDKLLRLSPVQFQELSTDVYDELLRRQSAAGQQTNGPGQVPPYLLPKDNFHPKRNQAREKLATLPSPRFKDLATDVFYELERRFPMFAARDIPRNGSPASSIGGYGPPSRVGTPNGMRPDSRGGGRPGGGGGPGYGPRNQSLSGQVMGGVNGLGGQEEPYGRPTAKAFQSNTLIPNKSIMVEDDDDDNISDVYGSRRDTTYTSRSGAGSEKDRKVIAEYETQVADLLARVKDLEDQVHDKDSELDMINQRQTDNKVERERWTGLQADLEAKLRNARNLNNNLQSELDKLRNEHASSERELRSQMESMAGRAKGGSEWKSRYESLNQSHQDLQIELRRQEQVTSKVRQEASGFLDQMKVLSERTGQSLEHEERLVQQVHKLENELQDWKSRYARAKTQTRTLRNSLVGSIQQPDAGGMARTAGFMGQEGLIKDVHVTRFQIAIDELLQSARGPEPQAVLPHVKSVVIAVRQISMDVGDTSTDHNESAQQFHKLKTKVSATATNLITAAKNFASSHGLLPISLLDAAASHLAASLVELIRVVKMRPTPTNELDDDLATRASPEDPYNRFSVDDDSIYSARSSPQEAQRAQALNHHSKPSNSIPNGTQNGLSHGPQLSQAVYRTPTNQKQTQELKSYLETHHPPLNTQIQTLITAIRTSSPPPQILDQISTITTAATALLHHAAPRLAPITRAHAVANDIATAVERLEEKGREGEAVGGGEKGEKGEKGWRGFVMGVPEVAFRVGRGVGELRGCFEGGV